jgi:hypothetical protein
VRTSAHARCASKTPHKTRLEQEHRGARLTPVLSQYSHVRMEAKRRAFDEVASRQREADEKRKRKQSDNTKRYCFPNRRWFGNDQRHPIGLRPFRDRVVTSTPSTQPREHLLGASVSSQAVSL